MRYVVAAVHELSRHATKAEADRESRSYAPDDKITYVVVDTQPDRGGAVAPAPGRGGRRESRAGIRKSQSRKSSRGR